MTIWKVAEAKQSLSRLLKDAGVEPQLIHKREELVAAVLGAEEAREYLEWRRRRRVPPLSELVHALARASAEEDYRLPDSHSDLQRDSRDEKATARPERAARPSRGAGVGRPTRC